MQARLLTLVALAALAASWTEAADESDVVGAGLRVREDGSEGADGLGAQPAMFPDDGFMDVPPRRESLWTAREPTVEEAVNNEQHAVKEEPFRETAKEEYAAVDTTGNEESTAIGNPAIKGSGIATVKAGSSSDAVEAVQDEPVHVGRAVAEAPTSLGLAVKEDGVSPVDSSTPTALPRVALEPFENPEPLVVDAEEPQGSPMAAAASLEKAQESLRRMLDQALREAEELAREGYGLGEDAVVDDDADRAINETRAELQKTLNKMLTDTQQQALLKALMESEDLADDTNSVPEHAVRAEEQTSTERTEAASEAPTTAASPSADSMERATTSTLTLPPGTVEPTSTTDEDEDDDEEDEHKWRHLVVSSDSHSDTTTSPRIPVETPRLDGGERAPVQTDQTEPSRTASSRTAWSSCPTKQPAPLRLPALPNGAPESDDAQCSWDSKLLDLHIRNHTLWAVQMQDAGAGGITGLLEGNVYHLGDFDECMDVHGPVRSQYCLVKIRVEAPPRTPDHYHHPDVAPNPMQSVWNRIKHEGEPWRHPLDTLHVALCAPASCGPRDLLESVQRALDEHANCNNLPVAYSVSISEATCTSSAQNVPFSRGEIVYITVAATAVLALLAGTLIDTFATKKKGCLRSMLLLFSLKRNWNLLTKNDPKPMGLDLDPLCGARTINMIVLVLAHRGFNLLRGPVHNYNQYEPTPRSVLKTGATHAQLFVDTFFVLAGLLVSLLELTRAHAHGKDSDSRVTLMAAGVHRYIRLTPSYAAVVFFYATVFWRFGSGPLWNQVVGHESEACAKYWWTNMFYVNNYINTDKLCMFQSWYLPCDLHLFLLGSLLALLVSRHRRTGLGVLLVFLAISIIIPFFSVLLGNKPALLEMLPDLFRAPDQSSDFRTMYAPTHIRAAPYMVGLLAGYVFQRMALRHRDRFTQGVTWLLCLGGLALTTSALLSSVVFYDPELEYSGVAAGLYASLCPVVWSIGVCLIFASLVLGGKTVMTATLSWRPLVVLSRLTYNVFLTHWAFQVASVAKARAPFHLDVYNLIYLGFGDIVASFFTSVLLFFLVEAPFRSLARRITAPPPESKVHLSDANNEGKPPRFGPQFVAASTMPKQNP